MCQHLLDTGTCMILARHTRHSEVVSDFKKPKIYVPEALSMSIFQKLWKSCHAKAMSPWNDIKESLIDILKSVPLHQNSEVVMRVESNIFIF